MLLLFDLNAATAWLITTLCRKLEEANGSLIRVGQHHGQQPQVSPEPGDRGLIGKCPTHLESLLTGKSWQSCCQTFATGLWKKSKAVEGYDIRMDFVSISFLCF